MTGFRFALASLARASLSLASFFRASFSLAGLSLARRLVLVGLISAPMFTGVPAAQAQTESVIHAFQSNARHDGISPFSGLVADRNGSLYGTTEQGGVYGYGAVYKLTPPATQDGAWGEGVLYSFTGGADGKYPQGNLLINNSKIFGTAQQGGSSNYGVVFELASPAQAGSPWTETVIYNFLDGADGGWPISGVIAGKKGLLYGTAFIGGDSGNGVVFQLAPPASAGGAWTEKVVHAFQGGNDGRDPDTPLVRDKNGALYGATYQDGQYEFGVVYKLTPSSGSGPWTNTILYAFQDGNDGAAPGGLVLDSAGAVYGPTTVGGLYNAGLIYRLTPPSSGSGPWTNTDLYDFQDSTDGGYPNANLVFDSSGNLYGTTLGGGDTTCGCGVVFELKPPSGGGGLWTEDVLHAFVRGNDGAVSYTPVLFVGTTLYGTTWEGGAPGYGTVFEITP